MQGIKNKLQSRKLLHGFTLVELIVVITILAILGTIGFISIQGYSSSARDASRISNLTNLKKWLDIVRVTGDTFPLPENYVSIMASGSIVGYQGFAKDTVGRIAKLSPGATIDPLDPSMFITYATNANQSRMQAMAFLENGNFATAFEGIISSAHAGAGSNYTQRYVINIGDNVGILIENTGSNINRPIQEKYVAGSFTGIDLAATTTSSGYTMVFSKSDTTASATTSGTSAYTGSLFTFVYNKNADLMKDKSLASLDSTLVAYWDMETLTGTLLKDLSGNGNNGTCYNGSGNVVNCGTTGLWPQIVDGIGKSGKAMFFDGVDDFIGTNLDMSWNQTNNVTIQILLRPNSINGSTKGILGKENPNWEWSFYQSSVNTCLVYWNTGGGHTNVMDNCWYLSASPSKDSLLTYTWDMSTSRFYLNNQLVTTHVATNPTINQDRTNGLQIGGHIYTWGDSYFNGIIDEIRIYKRTLSQYEVQQQAKALWY